MLAALGFGFDPLKFKPQLNMAIQRFKMQIQKKTEEVQRDRREISTQLSLKKFDSARIRGEAAYRRQREIEGYEIVQLMAELVFERTPQLVASKYIPDDLRQAVATIAWAAPRVTFHELDKAIDMLKSKFGSEAIDNLRDNEHNVHPRVVERLTISVPPIVAVRTILIDVATKNNLQFTPEENKTFMDSMREDVAFGFTLDDVRRMQEGKEHEASPPPEVYPGHSVPGGPGSIPTGGPAPYTGGAVYGGPLVSGPGGAPVTFLAPPGAYMGMPVYPGAATGPGGPPAYPAYPAPGGPSPYPGAAYPGPGGPPSYPGPGGPPSYPGPGGPPAYPGPGGPPAYTGPGGPPAYPGVAAYPAPGPAPTMGYPAGGPPAAPAASLPPPPSHLPGAGPGPASLPPPAGPGGPALDFDALNRRFAELKQKPQ